MLQSNGLYKAANFSNVYLDTNETSILTSKNALVSDDVYNLPLATLKCLHEYGQNPDALICQLEHLTRAQNSKQMM